MQEAVPHLQGRGHSHGWQEWQFLKWCALYAKKNKQQHFSRSIHVSSQVIHILKCGKKKQILFFPPIYFLSSFCFYCLLRLHLISLVQKGRAKMKKMEEGRSTLDLLLPCAWRIQSLLALLQDTQLTRIWKWKKKEEEVWGERGRQAREGKKGKRDADRRAGRLTETECQGRREGEGKKESRWCRRQNERVIEVKWGAGGKEKGGATWEKSNMGSVQQRYVCKRACYGSPLGLPR